MYAYITGTLEKTGTDLVVLDVGGIGYEIRVSGTCISRIGGLREKVKLYTSFQVREDSQVLYGFLTEEEKNLFLALITVSGIGPKGAIAILDVLTPDELAEAVLTGDAKAISRANGVGLKSAQKVIIELKDKIALPSFMEDAGSSKSAASASGSASSAVVEVLTTLGYSASEASAAVRKVKDKDQKTEEQILKEALKQL